MRIRFLIIFIIHLTLITITYSQVVTKEDSLYSGLLQPKPDQSTFLSGYGEAVYRRDIKLDSSYLNVPRVVTFIGHRFSPNILLFSAMEFRDIRVSGGEPGGEISMEQLFIKFNIDSLNYFQAGLFLPRVGLLNENHLPANYFSNERPFVETNLIPGVWREMGIGYYGGSKRIKGLYYNLSLLNGLDYRKLGENGTGIREATINGPRSANNLALSGGLLYFVKETFRLQTSFYYGGSVGLRKATADTLGLKAGPFGTPVLTNEANIQFKKNGWIIKILAARIAIPDAEKINKANEEEHDIAKTMIGGYIEIAYNFFKSEDYRSKALIIFLRLEGVNLVYKLPIGMAYNGLLKQNNFLIGIDYAPIRSVVIKLDYKHSLTGAPSDSFSTPSPFYRSKSYVSLGFGYSF